MGQNNTTLQARLEWMERLLDTIAGIVYIYHAVDHRMVYANRNMEALSGYTPEELQEMGSSILATIMHPDDLARLPEFIGRIAAAADNEVVEHQYRLHRATGEWIWFQDRATVFSRDAQGNMVEFVGVLQDISEHRRQEQALRLTQFTMDKASDGILWGVADGSLRYANDASCAMLGYTREELLSMCIFDVDPSIPREQVQHIWQTLQQQGTVRVETLHRHKDGHDIPVEVLVQFIEFHGEEYACTFTRDISERKQQEALLQESQQRLQFALEGSGDATWDWNISANAATLSDRYREMLGYRPDEDELPDTPESWVGSIHPDDLPGVQHALQEYLAGRSDTYVIENRMRQKSGEWLWTLGRGKVIVRDANGAPIRMTGTLSDIHARKQQEQALRLTQFTMDKASDGILWGVADGSLRYANDASCAMLGYTREELLSMCIFDVDPSAPREQIQHIWTTLQQQGTIRFETVHRHKDGHDIPVEVLSQFIEFHGEEYVCTFTRDISERKRAEAERAALQQQIIDTQHATLRELSTPLIPIANEVVIMPLIGTIDSQRAQMVMEALLEGVARHQATLAILDITGVQVVDTQVANALIRAAQAVKLLGAQVMLTGIQPQIAQTLVHLGVDLSGIRTRGSLQAGIADALK